MAIQPDVSPHRAAYRWEEQDYDALGWFVVYETPIGTQVMRQQYAASVLLVGLVSLVAGVFDWRISAAIVAVAVVMAVPMSRRMKKKAAHAMGKAMRPLDASFVGRDVVVTLLPDALDLNSGWKSARYEWRAVAKLVQVEHHLFALMVDRNMLTVPLRAFYGTSHFQAFCELARQYHRQARERAQGPTEG